MAVFRIERNRDYTVMSNHHLRDTELSLKSKGLLSMMLSLPEEWNYTTRGLAAICKEGADCIGSALRELEQAGYIVRSRIRDSKGKIVDVEYIIYETPHKSRPQSEPPEPEHPDTENPDMDTWQPVQYSEVMTKGGCSAKGLTEGCLTSGEDGVLQWTGLHPGLHYRLTEVKAPEGFKLLTETAFTGTVPADTLSVELTVVNARTFTMPETGAVSGAVLRVLGLAAAISCLCMLSVLSRKRH